MPSAPIGKQAWGIAEECFIHSICPGKPGSTRHNDDYQQYPTEYLLDRSTFRPEASF